MASLNLLLTPEASPTLGLRANKFIVTETVVENIFFTFMKVLLIICIFFFLPRSAFLRVIVNGT